MARYHVCMVLVGKLPVPATLGGAVEALAQHLLEQNERDPQIEFTVLTVDEPKARAQTAGFRHAKFVWFKPHTLWNKVWWRVRTLALNCTGEQKELPFPYQRVEAAAWLKRHRQGFDYVLAESELEMIRQAQVPPEKVLYHLHWVGRPTPWRDAQFGQLLAVSRFVGGKKRAAARQRRFRCGRTARRWTPLPSAWARASERPCAKRWALPPRILPLCTAGAWCPRKA